MSNKIGPEPSGKQVVGREQEGEQWRVTVGWPLERRAPVPHELSAVRKYVVVDVSVLDL